jgi:hypothetical protein
MVEMLPNIPSTSNIKGAIAIIISGMSPNPTVRRMKLFPHRFSAMTTVIKA